MNRKLLTLVAAAALIAACQEGTEPRVPTAVQVDQQTVALEAWDTVSVQAVIVDQHGVAYTPPPSDHPITWSTSSAQVVTAANGLIRAIAPGQATVTAQASGLEPATITVTVTARTVTAQLGFDYSDHREGSFDLDVTYRLDQINWHGNWGFTSFNQQFSDQDLEGQLVRDDGKVDYLLIWVDGEVTSPGARPVDGAFFVFGYDLETEAAESIYLGDGSVNFATVAARQMTGTFALELQEVVEQNGSYQPTGEWLDITSGTFELPVVVVPELPSGQDSQALMAAPGTPQRLRQLLRAHR
jgi:hypothetical protein